MAFKFQLPGTQPDSNKLFIGQEGFARCSVMLGPQARSLVGEVSRSLIAGWKAAHSSQSDQSPEGAPSNQARPPPTHAGSGAGPTHAGSGAGSPKTQAAASVCQRSFLSALLAGRREGLGGGAEGQSVRHLDDAEMVEQALTFLLAG